MSRYIDADRLVAWCQNTFQMQSTTAGKAFVNDFLTAVLSCPTADVVEVVRCKDCKYCHHRAIPNNERYECEYHGYSDEVVNYVNPTHYCSHGERREK